MKYAHLHPSTPPATDAMTPTSSGLVTRTTVPTDIVAALIRPRTAMG